MNEGKRYTSTRKACKAYGFYNFRDVFPFFLFLQTREGKTEFFLIKKELQILYYVLTPVNYPDQLREVAEINTANITANCSSTNGYLKSYRPLFCVVRRTLFSQFETHLPRRRSIEIYCGEDEQFFTAFNPTTRPRRREF